ncbi:MAG: 1-acyl-sn-glycerol-3-phosphate acyltransferase [Capsulimonas sp.]|uniref:lysophospholipid acyltransferase family protein n=1 Tax=Capsulimonas sp. TaxID=2494211 RepID=UPI0032677F81
MDFRPPHLNPTLLRLTYRLLPALLRWGCDVSTVDISAADVALLRSLSGRRLLITPNHPTNCDPALLFALSKAADIPFHYLACRETFSGLFGLWGTIIERLGAYSVVRGTADRESFRMTRDLLAETGGKVVIFPEGEVYSQNDSLLPFQSGVAQLAFWAMDDLRKQGREGETVSLLPVAVRYCFVDDMTVPIDRALTGLERAVLGRESATGNSYDRLRRIGIAMLGDLEDEYGVKVDPAERMRPGADLTGRMETMKTLLLDRAAALTGYEFSPEMTLPERMRAMMNRVYEVTSEDPHAERTQYREQLHREQAARVKPLMRDLNRVANWIAVEDNYVRSKPTPERMADNIRRLEIEVFGEARLRGRRRAIVRVGAPIDLARYWDTYRASRRATVARCTDDLELAVQALLDSSSCR